jgi:hypothetical protein
LPGLDIDTDPRQRLDPSRADIRSDICERVSPIRRSAVLHLKRNLIV